jgi:hypothetical protein
MRTMRALLMVMKKMTTTRPRCPGDVGVCDLLACDDGMFVTRLSRYDLRAARATLFSVAVLVWKARAIAMLDIKLKAIFAKCVCGIRFICDRKRVDY